MEPPASRAPPWEARSCLESTPTAVHTLPLRGGPYTPGAPPRRRASPWLCSDPSLSLEDGRPRPVPPPRLEAARVPPAPRLSSGARLRKRRPCCAQAAASGLPAPRKVPFETSQPSGPLGLRALSPPAPTTCPSNCSWLPSRPPCRNWASVYWGQISPQPRQKA